MSNLREKLFSFSKNETTGLLRGNLGEWEQAACDVTHFLISSVIVLSVSHMDTGHSHQRSGEECGKQVPGVATIF